MPGKVATRCTSHWIEYCEHKRIHASCGCPLRIKVVRIVECDLERLHNMPISTVGPRFVVIPEHPPSSACRYLLEGGCYHCCPRCNADDHTCAGCGAGLNHWNMVWINDHWVDHNCYRGMI